MRIVGRWFTRIIRDDIHLQAQYYSLWEQYLYEHGLKDDAFK